MALANECDNCGALYTSTPGALHIERLGVDTGGNNFDTWTEIDLCVECGVEVLTALGGAVDTASVTKGDDG